MSLRSQRRCHLINYRSTEDDTSLPKEQVKAQVPDVIGEKGRYQMLVGVVAFWCNAVAAWNVLSSTFFAYPMEYWCARPPDHNFQNLTAEEWKNLSVVPGTKKDGGTCVMYNVTYDLSFVRSNNTVPCHHWEFYDSFYQKTIISEWGLVCDHATQVSMSQTIYMIGFLVSVLICGQLSDLLGRRPILLLCIVVYIVSGLITSFSRSFTFFVISRFFVAFGIHGGTNLSFVLLMESVGDTKRPLYYLWVSFGWAFGFTTLPGLAYLTRDWAHLQLSCVCLGAPLFIIWWFTKESPRWLLTCGKFQEAERVMVLIAKQNRIWKEANQDIIQNLIFQSGQERNNNETKKANILDLVKTPNMRKKSLVMFFSWCVTAFVYYGIALNLADFVGDLMVNTAIFGSLEFVSATVGFFCFSYLRRRLTYSVASIIIASCCFAFIGITDDLRWLRTMLAALAHFLNEMTFDLVYIYSAELFPTAVRNVGVGTSSTIARIGSSVAPMMKDLARATNTWVPMAVFGSVCALAGILVLLLPETKGHPILDTVEEGEQFGKKTKRQEPEELQEFRANADNATTASTSHVSQSQ